MYQACAICREAKEVHLRYGNLIICDGCFVQNETLTRVNMSESAQADRVEAMNKALVESRQADATIQVKSDIFNAYTTSIVDLKSTIDMDVTVINKPYTLAKELMTRFQSFKVIAFDLQERLSEVAGQQKAIQIYLNTLANTLRSDERERLKIADINYRPNPVAPIKKTKIIGTHGTPQRTAKAKIDKNEVKAATMALSKEIGMPINDFMLHTVIVSKGCSIPEAVEVIKKSLIEMRLSQKAKS